MLPHKVYMLAGVFALGIAGFAFMKANEYRVAGAIVAVLAGYLAFFFANKERG